jgi:hypothetical protein
MRASLLSGFGLGLKGWNAGRFQSRRKLRVRERQKMGGSFLRTYLFSLDITF